MSQSLVKLRAGQAEATRIFGLLETAFEDDGYGIAITEIDEEADIHEVALYVPQDDDLIEETKKRIAKVLGSDNFGITLNVENLPDIDWVSKSLEGLKPVRAGRFLVHGAHDREQVRTTDTGIEIDAGQAFGTGHHGTTSGCLIMLERLMRRQNYENALDLGTGSAVLAIAIAKRSKTPVLATDIDPIATRVARANVALNGQSALVRCETSIGLQHLDIKHNAPFALIVANILPWPLMAMALDIRRNLDIDGDLVLSGILTHQRDMVLAKFRSIGLTHRRTLERDGWVTLHLRHGNR